LDGIFWDYIEVIRTCTPPDYPAVADLNRAVFGQDAEAMLVANLRAGNYVLVELVAEHAGRIVGHVLFSALEVEAESVGRAVALGPVAVIPEMQRRGIGGELIKTGLALLKHMGAGLVLVLGHESYYPRFGFSPELGRRVLSPYSSAGDSWMALELIPGALGEKPISVRYPLPWSRV
jgi:putative acetyltransferase